MFKSKKFQNDYEPNKDATLPKQGAGVLKFERQDKRSYQRSIYNKDCYPDYYKSEQLADGYKQLGHSKAATKTPLMAKQTSRDMKMYRQTEMYQNVQNENNKFAFLQQILSSNI